MVSRSSGKTVKSPPRKSVPNIRAIPLLDLVKAKALPFGLQFLSDYPDDVLYIANVGDSRIYLSRNGKLEQLSRDHTSAWGQWKRGEIPEIQYRAHPRRSALYEVIGGGHQAVCPHFAAVPYQPGDRFLICSDGLIDGLWERHIATILTSPAKVSEIVSALMGRAITNSGVDDTTAIVLEIA